MVYILGCGHGYYDFSIHTDRKIYDTVGTHMENKQKSEKHMSDEIVREKSGKFMKNCLHYLKSPLSYDRLIFDLMRKLHIYNAYIALFCFISRTL